MFQLPKYMMYCLKPLQCNDRRVAKTVTMSKKCSALYEDGVDDVAACEAYVLMERP